MMTMTVKELRELLAQYDDTDTVKINSYEYTFSSEIEISVNDEVIASHEDY